MKKNTRIIICGDLCPTKDTEHFFEKKDEISLFNDVLNEFQTSDFLIGNLEFVLTDRPKSIEKSGPILFGKTNYIDIFKKSGFNLLSLANNHIKDCGEEGVKSTIEACVKSKIDFLGAGKNIEEAKKTFIKEINGYIIGVISFAEQEFNIATENEYGSNYLDPFEDLDTIEKLKNEVDFLLVIYHGGVEYYEYPSPLLQKKCRKFIDKGADLVTCQHSHCIGTIEKYKDKDIVYGQGNTVFGYKKNNPSWNQGMILQVDLSENSTFKMSCKGITATLSGIKLMNQDENQLLQKQIEERARLISENNFVEISWKQFCESKKAIYFTQYLGLNRYIIHLNRIFNNYVVNLFYKKKYLRSSNNIIRCEAHNEVIQTIFHQHLNKKR